MDTAAKPRIVHRTTESRHLDQIESVVHGRGATTDLEEVSASWRRCTAELLINPDARAAPHIVTDANSGFFANRSTKQILYAHEEIDRLYAIVRQEGYVVLLCNTDGIAIHHRGDESQAGQFKNRGIRVGGVWSEGIEATNGIGTCITQQRPVLVHRNQHFRTRHIGLSCAGVPIFDPHRHADFGAGHFVDEVEPVAPLALAATKVAARALRAGIQANGWHAPHGYELQRRIDHAQKMLRNTDLPMSEIALSAGFADQSHLARHFRRLTGMPPSVVRREQR